MNANLSIYNKWVPEWIKLPLLIIGLIPHLLLIGLFSGNTQFVASVLDSDANDLQFLLSISYATIVVTLLIYARFLAYFSLKSYILLMTSCSIFILLLLVIFKSYVVIVPLRVLEGFFALLEGVVFLPVIMGTLKSKHSKFIAFFILYALMLSSGPLTAWVFKFATSNFGWQEVFLTVAGFHTLVLIITLYLFNNNRFFPRKPLYQLGLISYLFLLISLVSGVFVIIYGFRLNWFHSSAIWFATFIFLISGGLFILKEFYAKRKLFLFDIIKFKSIKIGVALFCIFYIMRFGYVSIYSTMVVVWKWPWEYVVNFQFINVGGVLLGVFSSGVLLIKGTSSKLIFMIGFLMLSVNAYLISCLFDVDVSTFAAGKTVFIQGIAQGWLFTPLVMYIIGNVPVQYGANASMVGTAARFWFTNLGFAISQNMMYFLQEKNFDALKSNIDVTRALVQDEVQTKLDTYSQIYTSDTSELLMQNDLMNLVYQQASLLAGKQLFTFYFWIGLITAILIFVTIPQRDKIKYYKYKIIRLKRRFI